VTFVPPPCCIAITTYFPCRFPYDERFMMRTRTRSILAAGFAALMSISVVTGVSSSAVGQEAEERPSYLFAFDGSNAQLTPVIGKAGEFQLTVPLRRPVHSVTWFTDRPNREAGRITMRDFINLCDFHTKEDFASDPPNVAIAYDDKMIIATMTDPKITTTPGSGRVFQATMTLVDQDSVSALAASNGGIANHAKRAGENNHQGPATLRTVTVFVDSLSSAWRCIKAPCCCVDNEKECIAPGVC